MYQIEQCPCCEREMSKTCPALLAPFIAERVLERPSEVCALMTCPTCGFRCFDARFDEDEMGRLYRGYRGEAYFKTRHRWEPWYTRKVNEGLSTDTGELRTRKRNAYKLISRCLGGVPPARILDYGGDRGQFIPDEWSGERYVFEVSGRAPLPGIKAIDDPVELKGATFDLVMLCQVLEHLSDPAAQLGQLADLLGEAGALYVEVPLERPSLRWAGSWPWDHRGLTWLARHPRMQLLVDLYSTVFRIKMAAVPPLGLLKASEHINFFTTASLEALMSRLGYQVLACEELAFEGAYCAATALGCVARKSQSLAAKVS